VRDSRRTALRAGGRRPARRHREDDGYNGENLDQAARLTHVADGTAQHDGKLAEMCD